MVLGRQLAIVEKVPDAVYVLEVAVYSDNVACVQLGMAAGDEDLTAPLYGDHVDGIRQGQILDHGVVTGVFFFQDVV